MDYLRLLPPEIMAIINDFVDELYRKDNAMAVARMVKENVKRTGDAIDVGVYEAPVQAFDKVRGIVTKTEKRVGLIKLKYTPCTYCRKLTSTSLHRPQYSMTHSDPCEMWIADIVRQYSTGVFSKIYAHTFYRQKSMCVVKKKPPVDPNKKEDKRARNYYAILQDLVTE